MRHTRAVKQKAPSKLDLTLMKMYPYVTCQSPSNATFGVCVCVSAICEGVNVAKLHGKFMHIYMSVDGKCTG